MWAGGLRQVTLTVVAVRAAEQRPIWRDGDVRDGGSQAGQEVALVLLVFPLDQNGLHTATQEVGAWTKRTKMTPTDNLRESGNPRLSKECVLS